MPYDNAYNRGVANQYGQWNDRFSTLYAYSPVDGRGHYSQGGSNAGVLFQMGNASKRDGEDNIYNDAIDLPSVYYLGNDSESLRGGNGFAEGTFRDRGDGHSEGASAVYEKVGGNIWTDIYHGFEDLGDDIGSATNYIFGSGHPDHQKMNARMLGRMIGQMVKHHKEGKGMSGGSWWDSLKEGVSDVVSFVPDLIMHGLGNPREVGCGKKRGRPRKVGGAILGADVGTAPGVKEVKVGGAILGNPDPYPQRGNSVRLAGRGKGKKIQGANGDLLAMPGVVLANGVPPNAQLRGSYGGAKPYSKVEKKVMDAVKAKMGRGKITEAEKDALKSVVEKHGGNLSGMTDKRAEMSGGDGRKARAMIVKEYMKKHGVKMIEASKKVKELGLYKK